MVAPKTLTTSSSTPKTSLPKNSPEISVLVCFIRTVTWTPLLRHPNGSNVSFNFKEKNLLGKGLALNLTGSFGTESVSTNISLLDPDFLDSGNFLKTGFFVSKYENETSGYENKIIGSNVSTGFEWFEDIQLSYGISLDIDDLTADSAASSLIKSRDGKNSPFLQREIMMVQEIQTYL